MSHFQPPGFNPYAPQGFAPQPPQNPMMQYAGQIAGASVGGFGQWFDPGHYDLEIKTATCVVGTDPQNPGTFFIVEFTVHATSNPAVTVGSTRSFTKNMLKPMTWGDIKALFLGLAGLGPQDHSMDQYIQKILTRVVESDNPLMGMKIHLEAFHKLSKKQKDPTDPTKGKPFTIHVWSGGQYGSQLAQIAMSPSVAYVAPPPAAFGAQAPQGYAPQGAPGPYPNPFGAPAPQAQPQGYGHPQGYAPQAQPQAAPPVGGQPPPGTRLAPGIVMGPNGAPIAG